jgi:DNA mismatch endonuclease (patch repair protein)
MDIFDPIKRSKMMAGVKSKNTRPEITVRKFLYSRGFRYRLHSKDLPGSPDVSLRKYKVAIFVHGCFWHRHNSCKRASFPASNIERWEKKFAANLERDARNVQELKAADWKVIIVWECEIRGSSEKRLEYLVSEILA